MIRKITGAVKNAFEYVRQRWIESHIDPEWLAAFYEANKDVFHNGRSDSEIGQEEDGSFEL